MARSPNVRVMYARAVDDAATRLRDLRYEVRGDFGLAALAIGLALAATQVVHELVAPLFIGGMATLVLGVRALWRRWDLLDRLADDRDAYVISEVRSFALRETTMDRRHSFAALIRGRLADPALEARVAAAADELEALAGELDDDAFALDPACAVACARLLSDVVGSPLLNPDLPAQQLRSRIFGIRSGFRPRRLAA
ncbi:MAG TPA: hypothetical protein VFR38_04240 [Gaiellaceae bacterium]|nr:hypothetical protein [Gaiellaceae bacterium]